MLTSAFAYTRPAAMTPAVKRKPYRVAGPPVTDCAGNICVNPEDAGKGGGMMYVNPDYVDVFYATPR